MVIDQGPQACGYKGCACEVPAGQTYCSQQCANASVEAEAGPASCSCGHGPCGGDEDRERESVET